MEQPILNTVIFQQREHPTQQKVVWPGNGTSFLLTVLRPELVTWLDHRTETMRSYENENY